MCVCGPGAQPFTGPSEDVLDAAVGQVVVLRGRYWLVEREFRGASLQPCCERSRCQPVWLKQRARHLCWPARVAVRLLQQHSSKVACRLRLYVCPKRYRKLHSKNTQALCLHCCLCQRTRFLRRRLLIAPSLQRAGTVMLR